MNEGRRHKNLPRPGNGPQFLEERKPLPVLVLFLSGAWPTYVCSNPDIASLGLAFCMQSSPQPLQKDYR